VKEAILTSFTQDPFKSPQVLQLQDTVQKLNQTIQQQNTQIALLRLQATQRLERQKEFIDSTERTKRLELAYKQWSDEAKQTQEGLMAILNDCLQKQDYDGAIAVMEQIKSQSNPIITDKVINFAANAFTAENENSVQNALNETVQPAPQVPQPPQGPAPVSPQPTFRQTVPNQQAIKQEGNATAPMPRPAVTPYTDA
jgi:ABC-type multidrug transport system fused ATPase/permease subunit